MRRIAPVLVATLLLIYGCSASRTSEPPVPAAAQSQPAPTKAATPAPAPASVPPAEKPAAPVSQVAAENREKAVPVLPFRPSLLLSVRTDPKCSDVYGYDLTTGAWGRLTEVSQNCMSASQIVFSGDGEWFGYIRRMPHAGEPERACAQRIRGGEPFCGGKPLGLAWRPGTHELVLLGSSPEVLRPDTGTISASPSPLNGRLSPGWKWLVQGEAPLTVTDLSGQNAPRLLDVTEPFTTQWLDDNRLALVQMEKGHLGKLILASVDGTVTPVGRVPRVGEPEGMAVLGIGAPDPLGRYLLVEYGYHAAVTRREGTALYDTRKGAWVKLPVGDASPVGWAARGKWLVLRAAGKYFLFNPDSGETLPLKGEIQGAFHSSSPDGAWLLFFRQEAKRSDTDLFLYRVATGESRKIDVGLPLFDGFWVPGP